MRRPAWVPADWLGKLLVAGLFVAVAGLVLVLAWTLPLRDTVPATVTRLPEVPADGSAAVYAGAAVRDFPFLKQATQRCDDAGGRVDTLLPRRAWDGWVAHVAAKQALADPTLVEYEGRAYRVELHSE